MIPSKTIFEIIHNELSEIRSLLALLVELNVRIHLSQIDGQQDAYSDQKNLSDVFPQPHQSFLLAIARRLSKSKE